MSYPKISIVTPNFNKGRYLEKTILSVLTQDYPNLEYVIIDGGSTDGSVDVIKKYANRLTYWVSEPDDGVYHAVKKGFEHTTGEIMAWIGSDDMYHPNSFFTVAHIFSEFPQVSWLEGAQAHYDEEDRTVAVESGPYLNHLSFLMHRYQWIQQESTFWRRGLYEKAGGIKTNYKLAGDFDLWMRFSRCENLYVTNALIGGFRHSEEQLSNNMNLYVSEADDIIARESVLTEEQEQVKKLKRKERVISCLKKCKILNWQAVNKRLMKRYVEEERRHRIFFDLCQKRFVLPE